MFSGLMNKVKKVGAQIGVVKTGEEDEGAKHRIGSLQRASGTLRSALAKYYKTFGERGLAVAAVHDGMGELYPAGQPFSANLEALLTRGGVWKDLKETLDAMRLDIENALGSVDTKLTTLNKMVQDRAALRIDIDTFTKDIAKYETDPKAGPKLEAAKAKLAESQEKFHTTESVLLPELEHLDKEIANLTTTAFQNFIQAQIKYNQTVLDAYYAGLSAIPVAVAPEGTTEGTVSNVEGSSSSTATEEPAAVVTSDAAPPTATEEAAPTSTEAPVPTEGQ